MESINGSIFKMENHRNKLIINGFDDEHFEERTLEVEEILFEGKHLLKELKKDSSRTEEQILQVIEEKKNNSKKIRKLTWDCVE